MRKIADYQAAGTEQVWVLYPANKMLHQYISATKTIYIYTEDDVFTPEGLFPTLEIAVGGLFKVG